MPPSCGHDRLGEECPQCRYDLTGIESDRCPECGHDIAFIHHADERAKLTAYVDKYARTTSILWFCACLWIIPHIFTFRRFEAEASAMPMVVWAAAVVSCSVPTYLSRYESLRAAYRAVFARAALWLMLPWIGAAPLFWVCFNAIDLTAHARGLPFSDREWRRVAETWATLSAPLYIALAFVALVMFIFSYLHRLNTSPIRAWEPRRVRVINVLYICAGVATWVLSALVGGIGPGYVMDL